MQATKERSNEKRDKLVCDYIPLAKRCAGDFLKRNRSMWWYTFDDAMSDAMLGLLRAASRWNPSLSRFNTYATLWMRALMRRGAQQSVPMLTGECDTHTSPVLAPDDDLSLLALDVEQAIDRLQPLYREVIQCRMDGLSVRETAVKMGVSPQRVSFLEHSAHTSFRKHYKGEVPMSEIDAIEEMAG